MSTRRKRVLVIGAVGAATAALLLGGGLAVVDELELPRPAAAVPAVDGQGVARSFDGDDYDDGDDFDEDRIVPGSLAAPPEADRLDGRAEQEELARHAKLQAEEAERIATERIPGTVLFTDLEESGGYIVYEVLLRDEQGRMHEVHVDAGDGRVLEIDRNED